MPRAGRPQVNVWLLAGICTLVVATVIVAVALLARGSGETGVRIYDPAGGAKDEVRTAEIVKSSVEVGGVSGIWLLGFQLTPDGAREFHRLTRSLAQRGAQAGHAQPYAFAVDGHVYARPPVDYHSPYSLPDSSGLEISGLRCDVAQRLAVEMRKPLFTPEQTGCLPATSPKAAAGPPARLVAAGGSHTCALTASGKANAGDRTRSASSATERRRTGHAAAQAAWRRRPHGWRQDDRRRRTPHVCADRRRRGLVLGLEPVRPASRREAGRAGRGAASPHRRPREDPRIAAGDGHTCAVTSAGVVECWGLNGNGQLGDGTTLDRRSPVAVRGLAEARDVAGGGLHTCALTSAGAVECWGFNQFGQLGDGTTVGRLAARRRQGPFERRARDRHGWPAQLRAHALAHGGVLGFRQERPAWKRVQEEPPRSDARHRSE